MCVARTQFHITLIDAVDELNRGARVANANVHRDAAKIHDEHLVWTIVYGNYHRLELRELP